MLQGCCLYYYEAKRHNSNNTYKADNPCSILFIHASIHSFINANKFHNCDKLTILTLITLLITPIFVNITTYCVCEYSELALVLKTFELKENDTHIVHLKKIRLLVTI